MNNRTAEVIGELGENHFKTLCSEVGITAKKPDKDKYGWDYFIEFLKEKNPNIIDAKIQVKNAI